MFGYIVADFGNLDEETKELYRSYYCGLCRAIRKTNGGFSRITLTYDFTFIVILLDAVYGDCAQGKERCEFHPRKKHRYLMGETTEYAADMNVLLSYINMLDDWRDDGNIFALGASRVFERVVSKIRDRRKEQFDNVFACMYELSEAERRGETNPDIPASAFGKLLGGLLSYRHDKYEEVLYSLGYALGKFVYIQDACIDFKKDIKKERYNPLVGARHEDFDDILKMLAADCASAFEGIDAIKDNKLIANIIYSGVWTRYGKETDNGKIS